MSKIHDSTLHVSLEMLMQRLSFPVNAYLSMHAGKSSILVPRWSAVLCFQKETILLGLLIDSGCT
jgi:hypothetical protein